MSRLPKKGSWQLSRPTAPPPVEDPLEIVETLAESVGQPGAFRRFSFGSRKWVEGFLWEYLAGLRELICGKPGKKAKRTTDDTCRTRTATPTLSPQQSLHGLCTR